MNNIFLFDDYLGLINWTVRPFLDGKTRIEDTDEFSLACLVFCKCAEQYDIEHKSKAKFSTYLVQAIRNDLIREKNRYKPLYGNETDPAAHEEKEPLLSHEEYEQILSDIEDSRAREMVRLHCEGIPYRQIGKQYGVTAQRVSQIIIQTTEAIKLNRLAV